MLGGIKLFSFIEPPLLIYWGIESRTTMKTLSIFLLLIAQMSIAINKVRISIDVRDKNKAQICTGEEDVIFGGDYGSKLATTPKQNFFKMSG